LKALYLVLASSGLRLSEVLSVTKDDLDWNTSRITPHSHITSTTKKSYFSFINSEAMDALNTYMSLPYNHGPNHKSDDPRIFSTDKATVANEFREIAKASGVPISPKKLRSWLSSELAEREVSDRYVDFLQGRTPKSVLARHYSDYRPEKLKRIYDRAGIRVLSDHDPVKISIAGPSPGAKKRVTLDHMKDAMARLKEQIDNYERQAISEEGKKSAEEMKQLWGTIDFLKGQLRSMRDEYESVIPS
jgi:hypothetical protein